MKTIGLLGGMSWQSTQDYYRRLNEGINSRLGGLHSASIILNSVDFALYERLQHQSKWDEIGQRLAEEARRVEAAGADFLLICTNTMHKVADEVSEAVTIPLLHIADATGNRLTSQSISSVGLLGTAFTMEEPFYRERLAQKFNTNVLIPNSDERSLIHSVIYDQLCIGEILDDSRNAYLEIIRGLSEKGAEAVILGCTEIGLLVKQSDTKTKLLDTTEIHTQAAIDFALG